MTRIISLFDYSGVWSDPYLQAGYDVIRVDIQHGSDVYDPFLDDLTGIHGVLAAPPCTEFARSGARWFAEKDADGRTDTAIALVRRTLCLVDLWQPRWWALENPPGRIHNLVPELGRPAFKFHPWMFGGNRRKWTYLWGDFNPPAIVTDVEPPDASYDWIWKKVGGRSARTKNIRSKTDERFARAFFEANP